MPVKSQLTLPVGTKIPDHIALILDGNRRWARSKGLRPWEGHKAGYQAVRKLAHASRHLGVHTFTIWSFSTENWDRPKKEIDQIMSILKEGLKEFGREAHKEKVRLIHLGRKDRFPNELVEIIESLEASTKKFKNNILNLALDYGGRDEILRAVRNIVTDKIDSRKIDEKLFESYLDTAQQPYPYPDLFIRTSGEQRTSGLMPWQMAYSEFYWEESHLPDFTPQKLKNAILDYSRRRRRFGGNDACEHLAFKPEVVAKLELKWWRLSNIPEGTRLRDYAYKHLKEQYGLSKELAITAARYMLDATKEETNDKNWEKAKQNLKRFYQLIKDELKLAFEPEIAASLDVIFKREAVNGNTIQTTSNAEIAAQQLYAEVYRISLFQSAKLAHLRVLAEVEKKLAMAGLGEKHWDYAQDYLEKFYRALKERVA